MVDDKANGQGTQVTLRLFIDCDTVAQVGAILSTAEQVGVTVKTVPQIKTRRYTKADEAEPPVIERGHKRGLNGAVYVRSNKLNADERRARKAEQFIFSEPREPIEKEHAKTLKRVEKIVKEAGGAVSREELVAQLTRASRKPLRASGQSVMAMIARGALVPAGSK